MADTANLLAYPREIQAGDQLGEHTVKSVSADDGKVTVTFEGGGTGEFGPEDEVTVVRDMAKIAAWNGPEPGTPTEDS